MPHGNFGLFLEISSFKISELLLAYTRISSPFNRPASNSTSPLLVSITRTHFSSTTRMPKRMLGPLPRRSTRRTKYVSNNSGTDGFGGNVLGNTISLPVNRCAWEYVFSSNALFIPFSSSPSKGDCRSISSSISSVVTGVHSGSTRPFSRTFCQLPATASYSPRLAVFFTLLPSS